VTGGNIKITMDAKGDGSGSDLTITFVELNQLMAWTDVRSLFL